MQTVSVPPTDPDAQSIRSVHTWRDWSTCPLPLGLKCCMPFAPLGPASLQYIDEILETASPSPPPPPPGLERIRYGIGVPPPLSPRGSWIGASQPRSLHTFGPYGVAPSVCLQGLRFPEACAPVRRLLSPPFQYSAPWLPWLRSSCPPLPEIFDTHQVFGISR